MHINQDSENNTVAVFCNSVRASLKMTRKGRQGFTLTFHSKDSTSGNSEHPYYYTGVSV